MDKSVIGKYLCIYYSFEHRRNMEEWIQLCQFRDCNEIAVKNPENKVIQGWSVNIFHCKEHELRCKLFLDILVLE